MSDPRRFGESILAYLAKNDAHDRLANRVVLVEVASKDATAAILHDQVSMRARYVVLVEHYNVRASL